MYLRNIGVLTHPIMSFDTNLPADAVEFCPHPNAFDIVVCGTYNLETNPIPTGLHSRTRRGQCLVLQLDSSSTRGL